MGLVGNFFGRLGGGGPQAISASAPATAGVAYTLSRLLGSTSTLSLISGTNGNLTLSGVQISQSSAIAQGSSQTAVVREYDAATQRAVEYPVTLAGTAAAPTVVALPSGAIAIWDAASLSALADGAPVSAWTDSVNGIVATQSKAGMTFVKNSGNLPAVRGDGTAILSTSGANAAYNAMTSGERTLVVVARNIKDSSGNPCLVSSGDSHCLLQANASTTGMYQGLGTYPCADAGIRLIGFASSASAGGSSASGAPGISMLSVNGTSIAGGTLAGSGGQINIGGWTDGYSIGKADILFVGVWPRALTSAEFKQIRLRFCLLSGEAYPAVPNVTFIGDSLTAGYPVGTLNSYPLQLAMALGLPWGTWDQMGYSGDTWTDMRTRALPMVGNVSGATGRKNIMACFEYANMSGSSGATIADAAQKFINAAKTQDSNLEILLGTATDIGAGSGYYHPQNRSDYIAALVAGLSGVTKLVRLDQDPNIGVAGSAPANNTANTWFQADDLHFTAAGFGLIDNGPQGFRSAVQARLAA